MSVNRSFPQYVNSRTPMQVPQARRSAARARPYRTARMAFKSFSGDT